MGGAEAASVHVAVTITEGTWGQVLILPADRGGASTRGVVLKPRLRGWAGQLVASEAQRDVPHSSTSKDGTVDGAQSGRGCMGSDEAGVALEPSKDLGLVS